MIITIIFAIKISKNNHDYNKMIMTERRALVSAT